MTKAQTILVVDDEPSILTFLRTLLEYGNSYKVETASSGHEAVKRMQEGPAPDLVLMDLVMPGMDGLEALTQMRRLRPRTKFIIMSCVSQTAKIVQAIRTGAHDYLPKPFRKLELDAAIRQQLVAAV